MRDSGNLVVVTGADGFIGHALCAHWSRSGRLFRAVVRRRASEGADAPRRHVVDDLALASDSALDALVAGATAIVHLAGRAHVMTVAATEPDAAFRSANVEATARLARAAVRNGVPRFILASSVKVNGEASPPGRPFQPHDAPAPADAYARSKRDAERELAAIAAGTATTASMLRLPLVYGPGVRANFLALIDAVARRQWLPLGALRTRRSLLYVGNLVTAIDAAVDVPVALAGVHFVADEPPVSLQDLIRGIGAALAVPARLVPVPAALLRWGGRVAGRRDAVARLTESLVVDGASFRAATGWTQACSLQEGLAATARWWRARHAL
jgi:nucleoside-diphosphate-sugar epimerase